MTDLTPDEAHYVLHALLENGGVRASQVDRTLRGRNEEIRKLRERLAALEGLSDGRSTGRSGRRGAKKPARTRARRKLSPKVRALRRLQGRYMGLVRGLKPAQKSRVRTVREKQGMASAIRLAASLAGKR
jgi:hypothetical protein